MFPGEAPPHLNNYRFSLPGRCIPFNPVSYMVSCFFLLGQERSTKSHETARTFSLRVFSWIGFIWLTAIYLSKEHHR